MTVYNRKVNTAATSAIPLPAATLPRESATAELSFEPALEEGEGAPEDEVTPVLEGGRVEEDVPLSFFALSWNASKVLPDVGALMENTIPEPQWLVCPQ